MLSSINIKRVGGRKDVLRPPGPANDEKLDLEESQRVSQTEPAADFWRKVFNKR
jgi:hypothetical protein